MAKKPAPTTPPPTLKVTNFGPIAEAEVELRPLTVFVGPSNTGKSYLAILLYALYRAFSSGDDQGERIEMFHLRYVEYFKNADSQRIKKLQKMLSKAKGIDVKNHIGELKSEVRSFIQGEFPGVKHLIEKEINRCFGFAEAKKLISHAKKSAGIVLTIPQDSEGNELVHKFAIKNKSSSHELNFLGEIPSKKIEEMLKEFHGVNSLFRGSGFSFYGALDSFYTACYENIPSQAYYLPADRTGVMHSHQVIVSALVRNSTMGGLQPSRDVSVLSGVMADFLSNLVNINNPRIRGEFYFSNEGNIDAKTNRYADLLEKDLLKGKIKNIAANQTNYPIFLYRPDGWKEDLPLMRSSSMVSELAPIVLYLRHIAVEGDMLIIEEPESHLHPAMQAKLACELARLVNNGYRIVLTTHSEWLLDQFANLVRLSELPEKERKKHPLAEFALDDSQFGAWLFRENKRSKGSVVKELSIDPKKDGLTADYSKLMRDLYNEWADIGNAITEANKK